MIDGIPHCMSVDEFQRAQDALRRRQEDSTMLDRFLTPDKQTFGDATSSTRKECYGIMDVVREIEDKTKKENESREM